MCVFFFKFLLMLLFIKLNIVYTSLNSYVSFFEIYVEGHTDLLVSFHFLSACTGHSCGNTFAPMFAHHPSLSDASLFVAPLFLQALIGGHKAPLW